MKKLIAVILALTLTFSAAVPSLAAAEKCSCGETPLIYVGPLGNTDIYRDADTENETVLFRISTPTILKLVKVLVPAFARLAITRNYDKFGTSLIDVLNETMGDLALDGNGDSYKNVSVKLEEPTRTEHGKGTDYYFHYDWRLDPLEVAVQLKDFVEKVKALTGHDKVNFKASSMGGVAAMSYFKLYGYDDVEACVFQCCPLQGTNVAGELLVRHVALSGTALYEYGTQAYPPVNAEGVALTLLFNVLFYSGTVRAVIKLGRHIIDKLCDRVFDEFMTPVFGTVLGIWAFVPDEYYEEAKKINLDPEKQAGLIAKADAYHYGVQQKAEEILNGALEAGVRIMIVAGYNMRRTPLVRDTINKNSDCTVDTCYASCGATVADYGKTLPDGYTQKVNDGHNHLSADGVIDASTCILPEYIWFIKDMLHANCHDGITALYNKVLYPENDKPFTVFSDAAYPQFLQNDKPHLAVHPIV